MKKLLRKLLKRQIASDGDRGTLKIAALFEVKLEKHDKQNFQARPEDGGQGRFLPALADAEGFRREWQGDTVFAMQLNDHNGVQLLRVSSDSFEDVSRQMGDRIRDDYFARVRQLETIRNDYDEYLRISHQRDLLVQFLQSKPRFASDLAAILGQQRPAMKELTEEEAKRITVQVESGEADV